MRSIDIAHATPLRRDLPLFRTGDTVRVHVKIREGEKERIQVFEGVVIRRKQGGHSATFTVRKLSYGVGVERIFLIESPAVTKLEIKQRGHVRRARLYYLRELRGKKARLRSKLRDLSVLLPSTDGDAGTGVASGSMDELAKATAATEADEPTEAAAATDSEAAAETTESAADSSAEESTPTTKSAKASE